MRSSLLPRIQLNRVCDACKQQRDYATASSSYVAATSRTASCRTPARPSLAAHRTQRGAETQSRQLSHSVRVQQPNNASTATADSQPSPSSSSPSAPARQRTHYDFFPRTLPSGPPPAGRFVIDVRALRREFLALQGSAHPDLHPAHLKARAQAASARINEAFRTLESPLLRAQYILHLRGQDVANDETAKVEDPELLMLVLETREAIEEADEEGDLEDLKAENEERIARSVEELECEFAEDRLEEARRETVRLRYWVNIRESINNWEKGKPIVLEH
ncbi:Co-chaperone Hsc20 [Whalleya microplaca]|nr:Co-chaperone Hsc20 [Whalleya microplaca]